MRLVRPAAVAAAALAAVAMTAAPASPATPNDPLYAQRYGPQQVHAEQAWATSTGAGAVIAVVDTGVDLTHEDLSSKLVSGATFIGCNPSCGNGDWKGPDGVAQASDNHGTHVAGHRRRGDGQRDRHRRASPRREDHAGQGARGSAAARTRTSPTASGGPPTTARR